MLDRCESFPEDYLWLYRQILQIFYSFFVQINDRKYEKTAFMIGSDYM
jgi:hypothetical protein